ncbi:MAG: M81 family metallopeptidase [Acidobacteria bacterium]|nr:M81 family metallopeptidase [Acidobacteriota bacterium]
MRRVGVGGFLHESNTFLPAPTEYQDFVHASLTHGPALLERWSGAHHELGGFLQGAAECGLTVVPLLATFAVPSGTISRDAYERICEEMMAVLRASLPLDGLLLALHGATVSEDFPDADGELLRRVRAVVGEELPIVTTFDLHANVSQQMIRHSTASVVYRTNPHLDQQARGVEAARLMDRILNRAARPVQALETPPMLIAISRQHTGAEPAQSMYSALDEVMQWPGILSASIAMGFYYADVAEMGPSFLAVADADEALARRAARHLADRAWGHRAEFVGNLPSCTDAIARAIADAAQPVVLMDVGDNVGGGSCANSTVLFGEALRQGARSVLVILYAPEPVRTCVAAEPGAHVRVTVGQPPVEITGVVRTLSDGRFVETQMRHGGWGACDQGVAAVVETAEDHTVVLTSRRMAPFSLEQVLSLGIHPERKKIILVKGVVAPRAAYEPIAARIELVDTPGATADNPRHFAYRRRRTPLYPLEPEADYP